MRGISKRKLAAAAVIALAAVGAAALLYQPALAWYRRLAKLPDENGIYQVGDHWFEVLEPVEDSAADAFAAKLQTLQGMLSPDNRVYWALVPDKGWYVRQEGYPTLDHEAFWQRAAQQLAQSGMTDIDLSGALQLDSYLRYLIPGDRNSHVAAVQRRLTVLGYYTGQADGIYGRGTQAAVTRARKDLGLPVRDAVDEAFYRAIGLILFE